MEDEEPSGHICLHLFGEEIHCDLFIPQLVDLTEVCEALGRLVTSITLDHFTETASGNARSTSVN